METKSEILAAIRQRSRDLRSLTGATIMSEAVNRIIKAYVSQMGYVVVEIAGVPYAMARALDGEHWEPWILDTLATVRTWPPVMQLSDDHIPKLEESFARWNNHRLLNSPRKTPSAQTP